MNLAEMNLEQTEVAFSEATRHFTKTQIQAVMENNESMIAVSPKLQHASMVWARLKLLRRPVSDDFVEEFGNLLDVAWPSL